MTTTQPLSNRELAARLDIHYTYASRLKSGQRLPSRSLMFDAQREFELTNDQISEWADAIQQGPEASGDWVRSNLV